MSLLKWAGILAILAVVAAIFGFGGIAAGLVDIALILFWIFVIGVIVLFVAGMLVVRKVGGYGDTAGR
jgi:uncharacterized membrane protein YtjA (UPF0391 family)